MTSANAAEPRFDTLDGLVQHYLAAYQIPGAAVGILRNGEVETFGYGVISLATGYPTRPDTLFQVGSNSKVFTATLVMTLVDDGTLDLDVPVATYLPRLRLADAEAPGQITLRHLLSHMSGLEGDRFEDMGQGDDALASYIDQAENWARDVAPGELWSYCNAGFGLAGRIVEAVTGATFEAAMRVRVFAPLGLERCCYFAEEAIVYSAAAGHRQRPEQTDPEVALPYLVGRRGNPAGGVIASAADMLRFIQFHLGDGTANGQQVLRSETLRSMQQPQARITDDEQWGLGWALQRFGGVSTISHGGATNGHISQTVAVPSLGFGLVILTNSSRGGKLIAKIAAWVLDRYCGLQRTPAAPVALPAAHLGRLAGTYVRPLSTAVVGLAGDTLTMAVTVDYPSSGGPITYPAATLAPLSEWEAIVTEGDFKESRVQFIPGDGDHPRFARVGGRLATRQP